MLTKDWQGLVDKCIASFTELGDGCIQYRTLLGETSHMNRRILSRDDKEPPQAQEVEDRIKQFRVTLEGKDVSQVFAEIQQGISSPAPVKTRCEAFEDDSCDTGHLLVTVYQLVPEPEEQFQYRLARYTLHRALEERLLKGKKNN
jgi:hypothetical protein